MLGTTSMIIRDPILLPTSETDWELWGNARLKRVDDPAALNGQPLHFALPLDHCRSFPLFLPSKDRKLYRALIYSQLEKRHLVSPTSSARFDFEAIEKTAEGTLVRVDFVNRELPKTWEDKKALSYAPSLRYYTFPADKAVLLRERGRLVLVINRDGKLLYSTILNQSGEIDTQVAPEIQTVMLSLSSRGFLKKPIQGVEVWGNTSLAEVERLRQTLDVPVTRCDHPQPESVRRPARGALLPAAADIGAKKRRKFLYVLLGLSLVVLAYLAVIKHFRDQLVHLQEQITSLEEGLGVTSANSANYSAAQTRWNGMVNAIDPRRYPLVQLNWISQVMPADGVILTNFESKISEVKIQGDANSAISWRTSISIRI
ncbi:MAG: hypothetical protein ACKVHP_15965 [Verrucomicrobiales bacterium]